MSILLFRCTLILHFTILTGCVIATPAALAQTRGELLYTMHCSSCHTTQVHWRDQRSANNWAGLKQQVRRWQNTVSLAWNDSDILEVARYLNDSIYHFETTGEAVSSWSLGGLHPELQASRTATQR